MEGNWYDRLKYKANIEHALASEEPWAKEYKEIDALLAPAFEIVEFEDCGDKYVYYANFVRAIEPMLVGSEYYKVRTWLARFELA